MDDLLLFAAKMRNIIFLLVFLGSLAAASVSGNRSVSGLLGSHLRY